MLIFEIIAIILIGLKLNKSNNSFFYFPNNNYGGILLSSYPINLSIQTILSNYYSLNNTESQVYHNCISFWYFIDSNTPKINDSFSIFNYNSGNPNICYNPFLNKLIILLGSNQILYTKNDILLQKWNHIVLNFNRGILDIFINGILEKSLINIIPTYTLDNVSSGQNNGIIGQITNIIFFKNPINIYKINQLYSNKP
uniref:LamG-like jellyroll fold domain-containing protein n=1 Tax=viral metagenome TaxID=1070528 RepID=A0A6C0H6G2_9ZZZZ